MKFLKEYEGLFSQPAAEIEVCIKKIGEVDRNITKVANQIKDNKISCKESEATMKTLLTKGLNTRTLKTMEKMSDMYEQQVSLQAYL